MSADPRVDPVGDVQRAIGTDRHVRGPEERLDRALRGGVAAGEIGSGVLPLRV